MTPRHVVAASLLATFVVAGGGCVFPFASEECEPAGTVLPEVTDADRDGYEPDDDCDETRIDIHPGAPDVPGDGVDQDCDGYDISPASLAACRAARVSLLGVPVMGDTRTSFESSGGVCMTGLRRATFHAYHLATAENLDVRFRVESDTPHGIVLGAPCSENRTELGCSTTGELDAPLAGSGAVVVSVIPLGEPGPYTLHADLARFR